MSLAAATLLGVGGSAVYSATVEPTQTVSAASLITKVGIIVKVDGVQKQIYKMIPASVGKTVTVPATTIKGYTPDVHFVKLTFDKHLNAKQSRVIMYTKTGSDSPQSDLPRPDLPRTPDSPQSDLPRTQLPRDPFLQHNSDLPHKLDLTKQDLPQKPNLPWPGFPRKLNLPLPGLPRPFLPQDRMPISNLLDK